MVRAWVVLWMLLVLLSACQGDASAGMTAQPSPVPSPLPTLTSTPDPTPSPLPGPTPESPPLPPRPVYTIRATIDYAAHHLGVDQTILYPNRSGVALDRLVLAVVPNLWPDCFFLRQLQVNGAPVAGYMLQGQRLEVSLSAPLSADALARVDIVYELSLPAAEQPDPSVARPRILGYTARQMNLVNWYPFVVPFRNGEWVLHDPWAYGEHLVYEASDFEVELNFRDATAPVVAASGLAESEGAITRYRLTAGRTFALSMSHDFQVLSGSEGDILVSSYYFSPYQQAAQAVLDATLRALRIFQEQYGPYPHKTLAAVMGDFNDGMEYSAFYFLSRDFYNLYRPELSPVQYLIFVAAHETAHQWWFERVANDQALEPWLDEAFATYSERVFYEHFAPELLPQWWYYRIDYYQPQGVVDIPVYAGGGFRPYTNAVYFRGAYFLENLRKRMGDEAFFAFLRHYLTEFDGKIATSSDFFRLLRQHTDQDFSDLLREYFSKQ